MTKRVFSPQLNSRKLISKSMNHKNIDELRTVITPQGERSTIRGPVDKCNDTGA